MAKKKTFVVPPAAKDAAEFALEFAAEVQHGLGLDEAPYRALAEKIEKDQAITAGPEGEEMLVRRALAAWMNGMTRLEGAASKGWQVRLLGPVIDALVAASPATKK